MTRLGGIVAVMVIGLTSPAAGLHPTLATKLCLSNLEFEPEPVPVGCEIIDCCPGCPAPGPTDLHVRITGDPVARVSFRFENLNPEAMSNLGLRGAAHWSDGELVLDGRELTVAGFVAGEEGAPPVAFPMLRFERKHLEKTAAAAATRETGGSNAPVRVALSIEQFHESYLVNRATLDYRIWRCPEAHAPEDRIKLTNNIGADSAAVFLDGRRSGGCTNDEPVRVTTAQHVGNMLSNQSGVFCHQTCNEETVVFSDDNAVELVTTAPWKDPPGDLLTVNLRPRWPAKVKVWVAMPVGPSAATEIALADQLYNENHCGIDIQQQTQVATITNASQIFWMNLAAKTDTFCVSMDPAFPLIAPFDPGRLNVYYLASAFPGYRCSGSNVIAIGSIAQPETLAHELGHAFSLGHTNGVDYDGDGSNDFGNDNVMWGGGTGRTHLTEAQCFRATVNPDSTINVNGDRTAGPTRACTDKAVSPTCPWLGEDITPN